MESLAAAAISIVAPYLAKGAEAFADEAGKQAVDAVKALVQRLQRWWSGDPVAAPAVEHLASDPKKYSPIVAGLLASELTENTSFADEVRSLRWVRTSTWCSASRSPTVSQEPRSTN